MLEAIVKVVIIILGTIQQESKYTAHPLITVLSTHIIVIVVGLAANATSCADASEMGVSLYLADWSVLDPKEALNSDDLLTT